MKVKENILDFFVITFGTMIVTIAVFFFLVPSKVSVGSIAGLAVVLSNFVPLSVSALTMLMNVVLLIFGFFFIGKEFGAKTVYTALLMPALMGVLEIVFPNNQSLTNDQTLDVICYCVLVSVGMAMLFVRNASSGGLDIVAKFMNKYLRMDLGKAVSVAGMAVALSSVLVYDKKTVVLSVLGTYFNGIVLDHCIFGSTIKKRVCVISKKEKEILDFILYELHSGATKYQAYGTYSDAEYTEINTIVDKTEYLKLINFITKTDPDAFVTVYAVNEMMYKPKVVK
ncbi:MAG: YitT family protein [Clostridiales bacterium]|nr:YitT family protein [Roseburia sp.]MDD7637721.1 YitT family protein [Clostridiales bacterium]MDY4111378.1 YitT family protein [Roseburia sp.]